MRIAFVLPAPVRVPTGGPAVVYRHAAGLAERGHEVRVIAPRASGLASRARAVAVRVRDRVQGVADAPYYTTPGVETVEPEAYGDVVLDDDAVIATGIQTINPIRTIRPDAWWFVQGDETYVDPHAPDAWTLGLRHIACSEWLADAIRDRGGEVAGVVPNAVDSSVFWVTEPVETRPPAVLALYHRHASKGPATLISVYERIRQAVPDAALRVFSARTPSHRLPEGVEAVVRPSPDRLRRLYNASSVFLHTSETEGWALTPMEAAACGCAVVATDSRGPREYLRPGVSMRMHDPGDVRGLASSAIELLTHAERRVTVAEAAREAVALYSWRQSTDRFEAILTEGTRS